MSNETELLKQLQNLPNEAHAPDRWQAIEQAIHDDTRNMPQDTKRPWWLYAVAASVLFIAALSPVFLNQSVPSAINTQPVAQEEAEKDQPRTPEVFVLTIESLQQGNASYYAKLGHMVRDGNHLVSPQTLDSLDSVRQAQQQYREALAQKPESGRIQQRLFWLYQKERQLLRQLVV